MELLGRLGTPKSRGLLQAWAEQVNDVHLAEEAKAVQATIREGR